LHNGGHWPPHEVTPITGGERWSRGIILWYKKKRQGASTRDRSADGPSAAAGYSASSEALAGAAEVSIPGPLPTRKDATEGPPGPALDLGKDNTETPTRVE
jgi:hypothetical protein